MLDRLEVTLQFVHVVRLLIEFVHARSLALASVQHELL